MDVSIIIPYNKDRGWLHEAVRSAENQEFSGTFEVIKQKGPFNSATNLNNGILKAKGKYIKKLDEDDVLPPDSIQLLYDKIIQGYDVVCSNAMTFQGKHKKTEKSYIPDYVWQMARDYKIHGGSTLYSKAALNKIGCFDQTLWTGEEYDLHLRLAMFARWGYIDEVTYFYRKHENQKSMQGGFKDSQRYIDRKRFIRNRITIKYDHCYKKIVK